MATRPSVTACLLGAGLLAFAIVSAHSPAAAQSADLVLCDRVAADPTDPDRPPDIKGVTSIAPADVPIAIKYCRGASKASRRALFELGRAYATGNQIQNAITVYRRAVDKGSSAAMVELGVFLATGNGIAQDQEAARRLFERAAAAGNPRGMINLQALAKATGAPQNPADARAMLARAAEANSAEAQYQLGMMMAEGTGGPHDDAGARAMFEKAAAQGHPGALEQAGLFAEAGRGGPQDNAAARAYFEKAAALGNENAKVQLKRLECPVMLRDKRGNFVSSLCF